VKVPVERKPLPKDALAPLLSERHPLREGVDVALGREVRERPDDNCRVVAP
jgi:hypothetical protein